MYEGLYGRPSYYGYDDDFLNIYITVEKGLGVLVCITVMTMTAMKIKTYV